MTDELLERAVGAYRRETAADSDGADEVLARIGRSRRGRPLSSRRAFRTGAMTLAAALATAGAWAGATGRLPALVTRVAALAAPFGASAPPPVSRPKRQAVVRTPESTNVGEPPRITETLPVEASGAVAAMEAPSSKRAARSRMERPVANPPKETASEEKTAEAVVAPSPDVDVLYRAAHDAHFKSRDYAAALSAWDAYLAAAGPGSRMLIEARYNRGVALSQLGRREEAVRALEPFANGEYGEYRRSEARRMIEKLGR